MKERFNPTVKLAAHEKFSRFLKGEKVYPINIEVSPSQACNAHCSWCFYAGTHGKLKENIMDSNLMLKLINEVKELETEAITWTGGGEPTLHPDFDYVTRYANLLGIKQGLFTNALLKANYDPSIFSWIRVSNTDKDFNENNLKYLRDRTKVLGMAVNYSGDDEVIKKAVDLGEKVGVDYVQIRQALNLRGLVTERLPPKIDNKRVFLTEYKFDDSSNPHGYSKCYGFNFVPFIWHNGNVDVCGYMRNEGKPYTLGNLNEKSLKQIIDESPRDVDVKSNCQVCCKNHEINKLINTGLQLKDRSFI